MGWRAATLPAAVKKVERRVPEGPRLFAFGTARPYALPFTTLKAPWGKTLSTRPKTGEQPGRNRRRLRDGSQTRGGRTNAAAEAPAVPLLSLAQQLTLVPPPADRRGREQGPGRRLLGRHGARWVQVWELPSLLSDGPERGERSARKEGMARGWRGRPLPTPTTSALSHNVPPRPVRRGCEGRERPTHMPHCFLVFAHTHTHIHTHCTHTRPRGHRGDTRGHARRSPLKTQTKTPRTLHFSHRPS